MECEMEYGMNYGMCSVGPYPPIILTIIKFSIAILLPRVHAQGVKQSVCMSVVVKLQQRIISTKVQVGLKAIHSMYSI